MKLKNALILLLTATIWGVAFVAQSVGMDYVQPFTFNGVRSIIGGLVLIPVILVLDRKKKAEEKDYKERLGICMDCDNLINGMCKLCGCYVEMRAAVKKNYCPNIERKWDKIS